MFVSIDEITQLVSSLPYGDYSIDKRQAVYNEWLKNKTLTDRMPFIIMGKTNNRVADNVLDDMDRLNQFAKEDEEALDEGTSTYYKFTEEGETINVLFLGTEQRELDKEKSPGKMTECAVCKTKDGKILLAQTIIVNELKKKWDELKEVPFPARIKYTGKKGEGSGQYMTFSIMFEKAAPKG